MLRVYRVSYHSERDHSEHMVHVLTDEQAKAASYAKTLDEGVRILSIWEVAADVKIPS